MTALARWGSGGLPAARLAKLMLKPPFGMWILLGCIAGPVRAATAARVSADKWPDSRLEQAVAEFGIGQRAGTDLLSGNRAALIARLEQLQGRTPATTVLYRHLTFALAYLGHDYRRNVQRLVYPVHLFETDRARFGRYQDSDGPEDPGLLDDVPAMLQRLYERKPDHRLLRILFSMALDGEPSEELASRRVELLTGHPSACLQTVRHSATLTANAVEDFDLASPVEYAAAVSSIRKAARGGDPALRLYVRRFLREIAAARKRVEEQNRPRRRSRVPGARDDSHR